MTICDLSTKSEEESRRKKSGEAVQFLSLTQVESLGG